MSYYIDELFEKRIIVIDKEITEESASEWISKIILLDLKGAAQKQPIIILINSFGGEPNCALSITDIIQNSISPVVTVCIGVAISGGSIILGAGTKRYSLPNASIMMHQHVTDIGQKNHTEIMNEAEASKKLFKQIEDYYVKVTKQSHLKIKKMLIKDSYLTAKNALDIGLIDEINGNIYKIMGTNSPRQ